MPKKKTRLNLKQTEDELVLYMIKRQQAYQEKQYFISDFFNEKALFADGFEDALIGIAERAPSGNAVAVYDIKKMIDILIKRDGMDYLDAIEYIDFNVIGADMGENQPKYIHLFDDLI
jgi:hypothetical protein